MSISGPQHSCISSWPINEMAETKAVCPAILRPVIAIRFQMCVLPTQSKVNKKNKKLGQWKNRTKYASAVSNPSLGWQPAARLESRPVPTFSSRHVETQTQWARKQAAGSGPLHSMSVAACRRGWVRLHTNRDHVCEIEMLCARFS